MSYLTWHNKYSVGVKNFDSDHMVLMDLINQLHDSYAGGKGLEALDFAFESLMDYTKGHLSREEALMAEYGYPDLSAHMEAHNEMKREVTGFYERYRETGDEDICLELLGFLTNWWHFHILEVDKAYETFFRDKKVA